MIPDLFLTPDERENPDTRIDEGKPPGVAWTEGNHVRASTSAAMLAT